MTDYSPEKKLTVIKHLVNGKTADVVATITRLDRYEVIDIASHYGYPSTEKMAKAVDALTAKIERDQAAAVPTTSAPTVVHLSLIHI